MTTFAGVCRRNGLYKIPATHAADLLDGLAMFGTETKLRASQKDRHLVRSWSIGFQDGRCHEA